MMCFRAGSVRELLRSSSSKFIRLWLQFSLVQFPSSNLLWKVRSVQLNKVPLISKVQFVQFKVQSVQFSSTFSSVGRPPPTDEAAFSVPTVRDPTSRPWTDPGGGGVLGHGPRRADLKASSDHLKKSQSSMENERFSYENKDQEEPEGEKHGMRYHKN